jgi:glycosyltransferase involved in cell wall biosynthesis
MSGKRLVVIGPLPPPFHGVAVSTALVLANPVLGETFSVEHLDTTDGRSISNLGKWDATNVRLGMQSVLRLARKLVGQPGVIYLPLSENVGGFLRDSLFIHLGAIRGWKVTVHCRNSLFRRFYEEQGVVMRFWIRLTMRRIRALAVLGERLRPLFDGFLPPERVSVLPNGTPDFNRGSFEPQPGKVLYLSNLRRKKGADLAVKAALLVLEQDPRAEFVFAGTWEDQAFEKEVRSLATGAHGRITFLPPVAGEEKRALMASAWILLFPVSWGEGHPRIILEALAAGLPVVTTDRATIADTVVDCESGYVLPDPAPELLADRLLILLRDADLRDRMSRAARERYLGHFTQETADRRIADWLQEVARSS